MTELRPDDKHHRRVDIHASSEGECKKDGPLPRSEGILILLVLYYELVMFGYNLPVMNAMHILKCRVGNPCVMYSFRYLR